jgi:uncharacterized cupredoxin-like copper-binding protein
MSLRARTVGPGLLAAAALFVAGCGGGGSASSSSASSTGAAAGSQSIPGETGQHAPTGAGAAGGSGGTLHLSADAGGALRFNTNSLTASAGKVTLVMTNPSQLTHSIAITGNGVSAAGEVVGPAGKSTVSATLRPGTYTFYCTVPGHREAGMSGTLTVR